MNKNFKILEKDFTNGTISALVLGNSDSIGLL